MIELLKTIILVSVSAPTLLFLSIYMREYGAFFIPLWFVSLMLDLHTTHRIYLENPDDFKNTERNRIFALLVENMGFKRSALMFSALVEVPSAIIFSLTLLQVVYMYLFNSPSPAPLPCLYASFALFGVGHTQAALKNFKYLRFEKK